MGIMDAAIAIYLLAYLAIMMVICVIGYFRNFRGKSEAEIEKMFENEDTVTPAQPDA